MALIFQFISFQVLQAQSAIVGALWRGWLERWGFDTGEQGPTQSLGGQESGPLDVEIELCEQSPSYLLKSVKLT